MSACRKKFKTVADVRCHNLCVGCGVCSDVCPASAIEIRSERGVYRPHIKEDRCLSEKGCSLCLKVCPGIGMELCKTSEKLFSSDEHNAHNYVGRYLSCHTGYSTDVDLRYRSSSGGLVSQLLIYLLEKKYIDGAVVTAYDRDSVFLNKPFIARSREDVLRGRGSKYCPVSFDGIVKEIECSSGRYVIVGVPCHIQALRKYEKIRPKFRERVFGYFSLYCSNQRSFYVTEYIFNRFGLDRSELTDFSYRSYGCLGSMVACRNGCSDPFFSVPFKSYDGLRSFFVPRRCISCIDHFGELADLSFGDIHYGKYCQDEIGTGSLVVRSEVFSNVLKCAEEDGAICLTDLEDDVLCSSQKVLRQKKGRNFTVIKLDRLLGKSVPEYDVELNDPNFITSCVSYVHTLVQMFVGRHKRLWFLIQFFCPKYRSKAFDKTKREAFLR